MGHLFLFLFLKKKKILVGSDRPKWALVGKLGIVDSCKFGGDSSFAGHSHPLLSVKSTFFLAKIKNSPSKVEFGLH